MAALALAGIMVLALAAMAVMGLGQLVTLPDGLFFTALAVAVLAAVVSGWLTGRSARADGVGAGTALRRSLSEAARTLWTLVMG